MVAWLLQLGDPARADDAVGGSAGAPAGEYLLGPGDVVRMEVFGEETLSGDLEVSPVGRLELLCGSVPVENASAREAAALVTECFRDGWLTHPQITLTVTAHRSQRVEVLGAVSKSEPQYLRGPTTLRQLLGTVGLVAEKSNGLVVVTRADGSRVEVPIVELDGPGGSLQMVDGDVVNVTEGRFVYVGGEVARPGPIPYVEGMTASQAFLKAGGNSGLGNAGGARVLRGEERIRVNLRRILRGRGDDLPLQAEDRIIIPESAL